MSMYGSALFYFTDPVVPLETRVQSLRSALTYLYTEVRRIEHFGEVVQPLTRGWNFFYLQLYHNEYARNLAILRAMDGQPAGTCNCLMCEVEGQPPRNNGRPSPQQQEPPPPPGRESFRDSLLYSPVTSPPTSPPPPLIPLALLEDEFQLSPPRNYAVEPVDGHPLNLRLVAQPPLPSEE